MVPTLVIVFLSLVTSIGSALLRSRRSDLQGCNFCNFSVAKLVESDAVKPAVCRFVGDLLVGTNLAIT